MSRKHRQIMVLVVLLVAVLLSVLYKTKSTSMLNFFKKVDQQKSSLGLEIFSTDEYGEFIHLVKSDLSERGYIVSGVNDGFLSTKIDGKGKNFGLVNLAQNCKLAQKQEWSSIIKNHFDALKQSDTDESELQKNIATFDKIKGLIAVQLYPVDYFDSVPEMKQSSISRSAMPGVMSVLVFDMPKAIRGVKRTESKMWNKSDNELFAIGLANVFKKTQTKLTSQDVPGGKVFFITAESFLTGVLALNLKQFNECLSQNGSLVSIPARGIILCHPILDLGVVKIISTLAPYTAKIFGEGPGSLSPRLYWYKDDMFTDLPYSISEGKFNFAPPDIFVGLLNKLDKPKK